MAETKPCYRCGKPVSSPVGPVTEEDVERLQRAIRFDRSLAERARRAAEDARRAGRDYAENIALDGARFADDDAAFHSRLLAAVERDRAARATAPALSEEERKVLKLLDISHGCVLLNSRETRAIRGLVSRLTSGGSDDSADHTTDEAFL